MEGSNKGREKIFLRVHQIHVPELKSCKIKRIVSLQENTYKNMHLILHLVTEDVKHAAY